MRNRLATGVTHLVSRDRDRRYTACGRSASPDLPTSTSISILFYTFM